MATTQIKGKVESMRKDKTAVCISFTDEEGDDMKEWFTLAEAVKPNYIKIGSICEAKVSANQPDEGNSNRMVFYIKCQEVKNTSKTGGMPKTMDSENFTNEVMSRMSALKASSRIYEGTGKEAEFKALTDAVLIFIEKGIWASNQKVPNTSKKPEIEEPEKLFH